MSIATCAVPGAAVPGAGRPGSVTAVAMIHLFQGAETLCYVDYLDTIAGHTLVAAPGGTYQIAPAGEGFDYGFAIPPPDGLWAS